jgi:hypothetical protein
VRGPVARRLLVLLDDLDLALFVLGDHRRVELVRALDLVVEGFDCLVVLDRRVNTVVGSGADVQGVRLVVHDRTVCPNGSAVIIRTG